MFFGICTLLSTAYAAVIAPTLTDRIVKRECLVPIEPRTNPFFRHFTIRFGTGVGAAFVPIDNVLEFLQDKANNNSRHLLAISTMNATSVTPITNPTAAAYTIEIKANSLDKFYEIVKIFALYERLITAGTAAATTVTVDAASYTIDINLPVGYQISDQIFFLQFATYATAASYTVVTPVADPAVYNAKFTAEIFSSGFTTVAIEGNAGENRIYQDYTGLIPATERRTRLIKCAIEESALSFTVGECDIKQMYLEKTLAELRCGTRINTKVRCLKPICGDSLKNKFFNCIAFAASSLTACTNVKNTDVFRCDSYNGAKSVFDVIVAVFVRLSMECKDESVNFFSAIIGSTIATSYSPCGAGENDGLCSEDSAIVDGLCGCEENAAAEKTEANKADDCDEDSRKDKKRGGISRVWTITIVVVVVAGAAAAVFALY
ncbi:hypothetical protein PAPHI01_2071 [Pancytospora philotis]|nr:hypothetical protein PAPHI01_2071 [Pancytospora philotis]